MKTLENKNIKRRSFLMYLGASLAGVYALRKLPMKLFGSKIHEAMNAKKTPAVLTPNPYAVSRSSKQEGKISG